eukprot:GEZU01013877.1.p1 GENE.GEZU01013877.1~~GEZU01013877.1.p1  ORF type:complete len:489 (+),score=152.94 GEZU01013877.1:50-1516(+)
MSLLKRFNKGVVSANKAFTALSRATQKYATAVAANETAGPGELKYSYFKTETSEPVFNETIGYWLSSQVKKTPYSNALRSVHQKINWSFQDLKRHSEAFANGLLELGLRPGDRLGIIQGTNAEQLVASIACAKVGAILTEFQEVKNDKDFERYMQLFRPRLVMMPSKFGKIDYNKMLHDMMPEMKRAIDGSPIKAKRYPFLKRILYTDVNLETDTPGASRFSDVLLYGPFGYYENPLRRIALTLTPDTPAMILLNNKDVNKAKPVVLSQKNLLNAGHILGAKLGLTAGDRVMIPQYLNTVLGAVLGNYSAITRGATVVYPSEFYNPAETLSLLAKEQCTALFATAQDLQQLLTHKDLGKHNYATLRAVVVDDSATPELKESIKSKLGVQQVVTIKGDNEYSGIFEIDGQIPPNTEVKVVREDNKILPIGAYGQLKIKGPHTAAGYWNDIGLMTNELEADGWFGAYKGATIGADGKLTVYDKKVKPEIL